MFTYTLYFKLNCEVKTKKAQEFFENRSAELKDYLYRNSYANNDEEAIESIKFIFGDNDAEKTTNYGYIELTMMRELSECNFAPFSEALKNLCDPNQSHIAREFSEERKIVKYFDDENSDSIKIEITDPYLKAN